jgi:ferredoxin--NADP+ reductase
MVDEVQQLLIERGLKKHRRRDPGNISVESYW